MLAVACTTTTKETSPAVEVPITNNLQLKACRIYSSEFAILDPNDAGRLIQEYRYNKRGFVNELIRYGIDGTIIAQFDIYGEENPFPTPGKPIYVDTVLTTMSLGNEGIVNKKELKKYNTKGLLVEASLFSDEVDIVQKNTYEYNNENRIIKDIYWDIDLDEPMQVVRYEYEFFEEK